MHTLKDKIKDWYMEAFETDELGEEIDDDLTFEELIKKMDAKCDVYDILGVGDSIIRERVFSGLVEAMQKDGYEVEYDDVYYAWLHSKPIKRYKETA